MSLSKENSEKLETFRSKVASAANEIVFHFFPAKVRSFELTTLIESTKTPDSPFNIAHASTLTDARVYPAPSNSMDSNGPAKRRRTEDSSALPLANGDNAGARYPDLVHANKHIMKLFETTKSECTHLSDCCDKVKLWVNLTMPNGDNFGVQIQEEVLSELLRSQESAYNIRDSIRQHYLARAKICSKLIKYPNIEDYALALREHDEKQLFFARQNLIDIRNIYAVITDILHKNITKIRSPRGNNRAGLY
ncbi:proteasome activator pa28 REG alpha beta subunit [Pisolithus croceorrhizus]|nr:proteasome activator pa28 REG alpha beta subunit [Pisolithus croceorrhizus]KAI6135463.1 proteasome activator pa28 REG alpha beta subunit [Pisolithus croceorrhizus]KAI6136459.1 proteasome activator pa28 REG alpha beta subunit [Pisolithus sp. B1]KAI6161405.1 proteasome activator pa28 REG alpha beta subunit [Pisolithus thermaeus]